MSAHPGVRYLSPAGHWWATMTATLRSQLFIDTTYLISIIRQPLGGAIFFLLMWITYQASGQSVVAGTSAAGFLLIGQVGVEAWGSTIWASGYAIQHERSLGTIGALFLSPASRVAVILGYGVSGFLWSLPSLLVLLILGLIAGARFAVADPLAVLAALVAVYGGSLAVGFAFASAFILSRRGNLIANALQTPIHLLAGFLVPRSSLPEVFQAISNVIPAAHSIDALRASTLNGASLGDIWPSLAATLATSLGFVVIGAWGLRRVEFAARRSGSLELY
ncbi:MAG: ABC transporter permease [Chloroflexia bacterium]|nr:ABC transporter permease [Chloroflexia bacterium]